MNTRQAKRQVCRWAAQTIIEAEPPIVSDPHDQTRINMAVTELAAELENRGGVLRPVPEPWDVQLPLVFQ